MKRPLAAAALALSLTSASRAGAEQPPPAPPPVERDSPFDDDRDIPSPSPAPAPAEPAPVPSAPVPAEPPPPAAPPERSALRPSPGPLADPIPTEYPSLDEFGVVHGHEGFFFRGQLGPSMLGAQTGSRQLSGGGFTLGLAAGHSLRPDLILQLDYLVSYSGAPTYEVDGEEMDRDISALAQGIGPAVTWYTVHNIYASSGLHASWLRRIETRDTGMVDFFGDPILEETNVSTGTGIGASATVGKEWWLSASWGLGIAARAYLATMPDADSADTTWGVQSFALLFSATMN